MRTIIISLILLIFLSSCGIKNPNSKLSTVIHIPEHWTVINPIDFPISANIFRLEIDKEFIGTGFVMRDGDNYLITNSHVAVSFKNCNAFGYKCDSKIGKNKHNSIKILDVKMSDPLLDFAILTFEWTEKLQNPQQIICAKNFSDNLIGKKVFIIGAQKNEFFTSSPGTIKAINFERRLKPSFTYDADTLPGMSGSPVFLEDMTLIGLHWGSCKDNACNQAIPFSLIGQNIID